MRIYEEGRIRGDRKKQLKKEFGRNGFKKQCPIWYPKCIDIVFVFLHHTKNTKKTNIHIYIYTYKHNDLR